jgi:ATP-dependent Lon protease
VQARLAELEKSEKDAWLNARNLKIETALNTLRARQAAELAALQKKIKTGLDEQTKDRNHEEVRLNQKYANIEKELRGNHDKEVMAFRGQFRSKGGQGSPLLLNKSKLLSTK